MTNEPACIQTVFAGALKLLEDCQRVVSSCGVDCTIMGGWNALLYRDPGRVHPGTFDVDLLLPPEFRGPEAKKLIHSFLEAGFSQSAKHAFQLLRAVDVGGVRFVYNVDLLHPFLEERYPEMFADLVSYGVPISDFDRSTLNFSKSIVLPGIDKIIWAFREYHVFTQEEAGVAYSIGAMFPTPVAFVCSKALALGVKKRPRDAYDIFLVLEAQGVEQCAKELYEIAKTSPTARMALETLRTNMAEGSFVRSFDGNGFFMRFTVPQRFAYKGDATQIVDRFLKSTENYPKGMVPYSD